jgi:hypothetical protein
MHEAGHCVAYDTATKYRDGYFRIHGKTAWPLVYVEELRADLLSFGFAARHLPRDVAVAICLYNLTLRFSSHLEGVDKSGYHPYGAIPFMLWRLLCAAGFVHPAERADSDRVLVLPSLEPAAIIQVMHTLSKVARKELVEPPSCRPTDSALMAGNFYRSALDDETVSSFDRAIAAAQNRG